MSEEKLDSEAMKRIRAAIEESRTRFNGLIEAVTALLERADSLAQTDRRAAFELSEQASNLEMDFEVASMGYLFQDCYDLTDENGEFRKELPS